MKILSLVLPLLVASCVLPPAEVALPLRISELINSAEGYDGEIVQVSGLFYMDTESSVLSEDDGRIADRIFVDDSDMSEDEDPVWRNFERDRIRLAQAQDEFFLTTGTRGGWHIRSHVEIEGRFEVASLNSGGLDDPAGYGMWGLSRFRITMLRMVSYEIRTKRPNQPPQPTQASFAGPRG